MGPGDDQRPPFLNEWPGLAMKLVLLHAAHRGIEAVAWTRGTHLAQRYKGLGPTSEGGYEVYTAENEPLGTAPTLEDARRFVPDGADELQYEVHGVRLPAEMRPAILAAGFPAWGLST